MFEFHHIGLACKNIINEMESHKKLCFVQEGEIFEDTNQKIRGVFLTNGTFRIELLEPLSEDSPINNYLKKGIRMYHQCYKVDNLDEAINELVLDGAIITVPPIKAIAFNGKNIAFVFLRNRMLVELIQK